MKLIGSSTRDCIDYPTRSPAVFSRVVAGDDREFLDCVDSQIEPNNAAGCAIREVVDANSVQSVVVLLRTGACDCYLHAVTPIPTIGSYGDCFFSPYSSHAGL